MAPVCTVVCRGRTMLNDAPGASPSTRRSKTPPEMVWLLSPGCVLDFRIGLAWFCGFAGVLLLLAPTPWTASGTPSLLVSVDGDNGVPLGAAALPACTVRSTWLLVELPWASVTFTAAV